MSATDDVTERRVKVAWEAILKQHFSYVKQVIEEEGPGLSIFRFLRSPKQDGSNCQFLYAEHGGTVWDEILKLSPNGEKVGTTYDPTCHAAICVQVPLGSHGGLTAGDLRLLDLEGEKIELPPKIKEREMTDK